MAEPGGPDEGRVRLPAPRVTKAMAAELNRLLELMKQDTPMLDVDLVDAMRSALAFGIPGVIAGLERKRAAGSTDGNTVSAKRTGAGR